MWCGWRQNGLTGFNGATAFQPWKVGFPKEWASCAPTGFNGATAFQPWKVPIVPADNYFFYQLQWSHGFSAVERSQIAGGGTTGAMLQWSHGFSAVERVPKYSYSTKIQLQHWKLLR